MANQARMARRNFGLRLSDGILHVAVEPGDHGQTVVVGFRPDSAYLWIGGPFKAGDKESFRKGPCIGIISGKELRRLVKALHYHLGLAARSAPNALRKAGRTP